MQHVLTPNSSNIAVRSVALSFKLKLYFPLNCHCETATVWLRLGIKSMLLGLGKDHAWLK